MRRAGYVFWVLSGTRTLTINICLKTTKKTHIPSSYIMSWDANNLYGWATSESLPHKDLEFSNATFDEVLATDDDAETGYILEVDLEPPLEIHEKVK